MELVFAGDRCCDHSSSSGYDQVCSLFPEAGWLSGRALEAGRLEWLRHPSESAPRGCPVFHVFYGDCSGKPLPMLLRQRFPGARIVSSVHQPFSRLKTDPAGCAALHASDALVTVSQTQVGELVSLRLEAPVYAIPHGVWTTVFRPRGTGQGEPGGDVLMVGSFHRDWEGVSQVLGMLAAEGIRILALGAGAREHLDGVAGAVQVLPRISEAELIEMYRRAAVVFLPFLDATASNALLESMSAGCPAVCPRLPALVEYLGEESDCFEPGRYDLAASRIRQYIRNPRMRTEKSQSLIKRAAQFDWSCLKQRYAAVYSQVTLRMGR